MKDYFPVLQSIFNSDVSFASQALVPDDYSDYLLEYESGQPGKGKIVRECWRKLENRWFAYEEMGLDYERAKARYHRFKQYLEKTYEVTL